MINPDTERRQTKLMKDGEHGPIPKQMGINPEALEK